jgi:hypothetical protein
VQVFECEIVHVISPRQAASMSKQLEECFY